MKSRNDIYDPTHSYVKNYEWGLRILFFVVSAFLPFGSGQIGLAIMSAITSFFLYKAVIQQSQSPWTSVWIYVTLGFWQTGMNMAQNAMTIAIMLYAVKFINNGDVKKWCITIVLASTLHQSAIFFLPVYWLCQYRFNLKRLMFAMGIVLFISNFIVTLSPYIIKWLPANYVVYMSVETEMKNGQIYVLFAHLCILLICILLTIRVLPPPHYEPPTLQHKSYNVQHLMVHFHSYRNCLLYVRNLISRLGKNRNHRCPRYDFLYPGYFVECGKQEKKDKQHLHRMVYLFDLLCATSMCKQHRFNPAIPLLYKSILAQ